MNKCRKFSFKNMSVCLRDPLFEQESYSTSQNPQSKFRESLTRFSDKARGQTSSKGLYIKMSWTRQSSFFLVTQCLSILPVSGNSTLYQSSEQEKQISTPEVRKYMTFTSQAPLKVDLKMDLDCADHMHPHETSIQKLVSPMGSISSCYKAVKLAERKMWQLITQ